MNKDLTFIVPAAGKSSRFKNKKSKIFYTYKKKSILEHIIDKCLVFSRNIIIISNRKNLKKIKSIIKKKYKKFNIKILIQEKPLGMGDAVYIGLQKVITRFTATIWADQIYIENETIKKTINYFKKSKSLFTFPVFFKKNPYTKIIRNKSKKFVEIGKKIKKGDTVMIVEAMKTMNHVPSTSDGIVKKVLVQDGEAVEFGQTLVLLK